ncbi:hypothetical protein ABZW03_08560 [Kitasatospora sp. NPDC004799]|uniref:hypothetical protein n=1 Tax=Kitasatospora sp. NPDC004799 TaxID=3154460 RepID=UPI0033AA8B77
MAVSTNARKIKTREEYRAEQRKRAPAGDALADYDPAYAAKAMGRGIPKDWPLCTCGADTCPDKGAA